jgi:toxin ParE1/3/4
MAVVLWTGRAERDLEGILEYALTEYGQRIAESIYLRIRTQVAGLKDFPARSRPGRVAGTREYVITRLPFIAVIELDGDTVHVLSLLHTAKNYP